MTSDTRQFAGYSAALLLTGTLVLGAFPGMGPAEARAQAAAAPVEAAAPAGASRAILDAALDAYSAAPQAEELRADADRALAAGVNLDLFAEFFRRAVETGLTAEQALHVTDTVIRLAEADLPATPVLSRYLQGMAKGVDFSRMDLVAEGVSRRITEAAGRVDKVCATPTTAAGRQARLAAIDHAAYALGLGVTDATLDRSLALVAREKQPLLEVEAPLLTLGLMVAAGVAPDRSQELVSAAWARGFRGGDLERLGKTVGRLSREDGSSPGKVVDRVLAMIQTDDSPERVFQGLDELSGRTGQGDQPAGMGLGDDPTHRRVPGDRPGQPDPSKQGSQEQNRSADRGQD